jgi:hypothetical protein
LLLAARSNCWQLPPFRIASFALLAILQASSNPKPYLNYSYETSAGLKMAGSELLLSRATTAAPSASSDACAAADAERNMLGVAPRDGRVRFSPHSLQADSCQGRLCAGLHTCATFAFREHRYTRKDSSKPIVLLCLLSLRASLLNWANFTKNRKHPSLRDKVARQGLPCLEVLYCTIP